VKLLLDTCAFLWLLEGSVELSQVARDLFADRENDIYLSAASIWEILVKQSIGKLSLPSDTAVFLRVQREAHGIASLPMHESAVSHLMRIPKLHKDPFDRMLICQAIEHELAILTPDPLIRQYPVKTYW